jgi:hypothetical protein
MRSAKIVLGARLCRGWWAGSLLQLLETITPLRVIFAIVLIFGAILQITAYAKLEGLKLNASVFVIPPISVFLIAMGFMVWSLTRDFSLRLLRQIGLMT